MTPESAPSPKPGAWAAALSLALAWAWWWAPPVWAQDEEVVLQKYLAHLYLGDPLETVRRIYPPTRDWPSYREPKGGVNRIKIQRVSAKHFPDEVDIMWVGMRGDRVVEIQLIYGADYTSETTPESLAKELALVYGEPKMSETDKFYWTDGERVLRVFYAQVPVLRGKRKVAEMRTSLQLMTADLVRRKGE
ncbi:MAG: hypothetical protein HY748_13560 [Elusimicrobia bacterium]|nr:hypothetical protein [Elusimicrobiota bacterium]